MISRMYESLPQLLEESIKLELNVSKLYGIFSSAFPEDADFWKKLSLEEENHAVLIKLVRVNFYLLTNFQVKFCPLHWKISSKLIID